jgi:hypothetical protein
LQAAQASAFGELVRVRAPSAARTSQHDDSNGERSLGGAREQPTLQTGRRSRDGAGQCGGSGGRGSAQARWHRRPASARRPEEGHAPVSAQAERARSGAGRACASSATGGRNRWFLPNGDFTVSSCLGAREDVVSPLRNRFLFLASLSLFINLPSQHLCLGGTSFNREGNHHKCPLGLPLDY